MTSTVRRVDPKVIRPNPNNPRRYFNEDRLDNLRTSIQEVGVLVPLIVYRTPGQESSYTLLDGERRLVSALGLGIDVVPVNVIGIPSPLDGLLRMFNIHAVREEWPLVSVALSLQEIIELSGEERETRLADMTGLSRSAVRRAKRLLSLPPRELELIKNDAELDRSEQIHREDLYLEILAAESVLRRSLPNVMADYSRDYVIRQFARKREENELRSVTGFRAAAKLGRAIQNGLISSDDGEKAVRLLIEDTAADPQEIFEQFAGLAVERDALVKQVSRISGVLVSLHSEGPISPDLRGALENLRVQLDTVLSEVDSK